MRGAIVGSTTARFAHRWAWDGGDAVEITLVTWTVPPQAGGSRISLRHDGWDEAGLDVDGARQPRHYWAGYLDDLLDVPDVA